MRCGTCMVFCAYWVLVVNNNLLFSVFPILDNRNSHLFSRHYFCKIGGESFQFSQVSGFLFHFEEECRGIEERPFQFRKTWVIIWTLLPVWLRTDGLLNFSRPQCPDLWNEDKNTFLRVTVRTSFNILFVKNQGQCLFSTLWLLNIY